MKPLLAHVSAFLRDDRGATAIEYTMIAAMISISVVTGATLIGTTVSGFFSNVAAGFGN